VGISYEAKLIVGLPQDEIECDDEDRREDLLEELDRASSHYDCDSDARISGIEIEHSGDYSFKEITLDWAKIEAAKARFRELTGQEGRLYLSLHSS
jgi:hypothetical protein